MKNDSRYVPVAWKTAGIVLLTALLASCPNPIGDDGGTQEETDLSQEPSLGHLIVRFSGLDPATVFPDLTAAIQSITIIVSRDGYTTVTEDNIDPATTTHAISVPLEEGGWTVQALALKDGGAVVAESAEVGVTVVAGQTATETLTLTATTNDTDPGTGTIDINVTWPAGAVDTCSAMFGPAAGTLSPINLTAQTNGARYFSEQVPSGAYRLEITLQKTGAPYATPVYEIIYVYDNLTSHKDVNLGAEAFTAPPDDPTGLSVAIGNGQVQLTWTDVANTETQYLVQRSGDGGTTFNTLASDLPAGTTTYADATANTDSDYLYQIAAENGFGRSGWVQTEYAGSMASGYARIVGTLSPPSGVPTSAVANASVYVVGQPTRIATSGADGGFSLEIDATMVGSIVASSADLDGTYQLIAVSSDGAYGIKQDGIAVTDQSTTVLSDPITVRPTGTITATFTLQGVSDHTGTDVYIPGTSYLAKTDSAGNVSITDVPVGTYNYVRADRVGYLPQLVPNVTVTEGGTTTLDPAELQVGNIGEVGYVVINDNDDYTTSLDVIASITPPTGAVRMRISEDSNMSGIPWELVSNTRAFTLSTGSAPTRTVYVDFETAAGSQTRAEDSIHVDLSPQVTLESPSFDETLTNTKPTFNWSDAPNLTGGVQYHLQVATEGTFASPVIDTTIDEPDPTDSTDNSQYTAANALQEDLYYWQVAIIQAGTTTWQYAGTGRFTIDLGAVTLNAVQTNDTTPQLSWQQTSDINTQPGRTYDVQLDNDSNFSSPIVDQTGLSAATTTHQVSTTLDHLTTYYWQVRVVDGNGVPGTWAGTSYQLDLGTVSLTSPTSQVDTLTNDTTPTFTWSDNSVAETYNLTVSTNSDLSSPNVSYTGLPGTSETYTPSTGLPTELSASSGTTYHWAVTPVDENGVAGTQSDIESFEIDFEPPVVQSGPVIDGGAEYTFDPYVGLTVSVTDEQGSSGIQMRFSEVQDFSGDTTTGFMSYSSTPTYTLSSYNYNELAGNSRTIYIQFVDAASNYTSESAMISDQITFDPNVYVSANHGNDSNDGHRKTPVATVGKALEIAGGISGIHDIRIAEGTYNESDGNTDGRALRFTYPISILGGYYTDGSTSYFQTRNASSYVTTIQSTADVTIEIDANVYDDRKIDGVTVTNNGTPGDGEFGAGIYLNGADVDVSNTTIQMNGEMADTGGGVQAENNVTLQPGMAGVFLASVSGPVLDNLLVSWDVPTLTYHGITNTTEAVGAAGVFASASGFTLSNSSVTAGNGLASLTEYSRAGSAGVAVVNGGTVTISSNSAISGGAGTAKGDRYNVGSTGVFVVDAGYTISGNSLVSGGAGTINVSTYGFMAGSTGIFVYSSASGTQTIANNTLVEGGNSTTPLDVPMSVGSAGIALFQCNGTVIDGNAEISGGGGSISNNANRYSTAGSAGIYHYGNRNVIVERNDRIQGGVGSTGTTSTGSVGSAGMYGADSNDTTKIHNNLIIGSDGNAASGKFDSAGVLLSGAATYEVVNNTIVSRSTGDLSTVIAIRSAGAKYLNNALISESTAATAYGAYETYSSYVPGLFRNNLFWDDASDNGATQEWALYYDYSSGAATSIGFVNDLGTEFSDNVESAEPLNTVVVNAGNYDYHVRSTSSGLYNAGTDVSSYGVTTDIDGEGRPKYTNYDIGYDEY